MRDQYNEVFPLTLFLDNMWLMSKWAAKNKRKLLKNNSLLTVSCAYSVQAKWKEMAPEIEIFEPIDVNDLMEGYGDYDKFFFVLLELCKTSALQGLLLIFILISGVSYEWPLALLFMCTHICMHNRYMHSISMHNISMHRCRDVLRECRKPQRDLCHCCDHAPL